MIPTVSRNRRQISYNKRSNMIYIINDNVWLNILNIKKDFLPHESLVCNHKEECLKHHAVAAWLIHCKHAQKVSLNFRKTYINLWRFNLASFHNTTLSLATKILSNSRFSQLKFSYFFSNFFCQLCCPTIGVFPIDLIMIIFVQLWTQIFRNIIFLIYYTTFSIL